MFCTPPETREPAYSDNHAQQMTATAKAPTATRKLMTLPPAVSSSTAQTLIAKRL
jgi:hypothetical protein